MKLHLAGGQNYMEGWFNVDWTDRHRVDRKENILRPKFWDSLDTDSVDQVKCEHFIEHIPHELRHTDKDGLIWFMEQLYRVCRDQATLEFAFPHFQGSWAYGDPTHCRFVQTMTLRYFDRMQTENGPMPDYNINCDFEIIEANMKVVGLPDADKMSPEVLQERVNREWNIVFEERVILKAHKPLRRPLA